MRSGGFTDNNFWSMIFNALTALGTVSACIISLVLATSDYRRKLDIVFIWGTNKAYKPTILACNICKRTIVVRTIEVYFGLKKIASFDLRENYELKKYAIIYPLKEMEIPLDADELKFEKLYPNDSRRQRKRKKLKVVITDTSGKKFRARQNYSYEEICDLLIGHEMFKD